MQPIPQIIPPGLLKAVKEGRCVFMLGAGASQGEGLPSAPALTEILVREIEQFATASVLQNARACASDLSKVATIHSGCFGNADARHKIADLIEQAEHNAEGYFHEQLARIPTIRHIVTTNWDLLLENAYDPHDRVVIRQLGDFKAVSPEKTTIIKMHGCRTCSSEMVLALDDYAQFSVQRSAFVDEIRSLLRKFTFVCVGYGMQDWNFGQIVSQALSHDKGTAGPHFFVLPNDAPLPAFQFSQYGFQQITSDGRSFIDDLCKAFESDTYSAETARIELTAGPPLEIGQQRRTWNPFEMFDTESLAAENPDTFVNYFIEPIDFATICSEGNVLVEGHRGSGKTMVFRYLSIYHDHKRTIPVPFFGFYVKLNCAFFDPYPSLSADIEVWRRRFHHYYNLVVVTGLLRNLSHASRNHVLHVQGEAERSIVQRARQRLFRINEEGYGNSFKELNEQLIGEIDQLRNGTEYEPFLTGPDLVYRFLNMVADIVPVLKGKRWLIFLDEWDNLREEQQKAVVMRLHDRDEHLRYRIAVKTLCFVGCDFAGNSPDITHDYQQLIIDHSLFESTTKTRYLDFLTKVSTKRLELIGSSTCDIEVLLPQGRSNPKRGYDYSGFSRFAMLSGGLIREFLELCKDAFYQSQPELLQRKVDLKPVPPQWQNHVAKIHAAIHYNNHRNCVRSDDVQKMLFVMGAVFHAIDRATHSQKEYRKPLTIVITDYFNLRDREKRILLDAVKNRLIQLPDRALQPRSWEQGPQEKYTLHRLMCPKYALDVHERYSVPVTADEIRILTANPHEVIVALTKGYKDKGIDQYLPDSGSGGTLFDKSLYADEK